jgi:hypothetical protein
LRRGTAIDRAASSAIFAQCWAAWSFSCVFVLKFAATGASLDGAVTRFASV